MGGKIFVNYRRDDSAPHALNIAQYLESRFGKNSVFIDIDRIRAGQNFPDVLEDKLAFCKVMLSVIGPKWLDAKNEKTGGRRIDNPDDWVRLEIEQALARGVTVVPVLVAGARLPSKDELPDTLKRLVEHQVATITTNGFRHEMAGLANDICRRCRATAQVARSCGRGWSVRNCDHRRGYLAGPVAAVDRAEPQQ